MSAQATPWEDVIGPPWVETPEARRATQELWVDTFHPGGLARLGATVVLRSVYLRAAVIAASRGELVEC